MYWARNIKNILNLIFKLKIRIFSILSLFCECICRNSKKSVDHAEPTEKMDSHDQVIEKEQANHEDLQNSSTVVSSSIESESIQPKLLMYFIIYSYENFYSDINSIQALPVWITNSSPYSVSWTFIPRRPVPLSSTIWIRYCSSFPPQESILLLLIFISMYSILCCCSRFRLFLTYNRILHLTRKSRWFFPISIS